MKCSRGEGFGPPYDHFNLATNNLGVLFGTEANNYQNNPLIPPNYAHIHFEEVIQDTNNWVYLNGQFTADAAYEFLSIGNFFDSTLTHIVGTDPSAESYPYGSYYLIDDICLSESTECLITNVQESESEQNCIYLLSNVQLGIKSTFETDLKIYSADGQLVITEQLEKGQQQIKLSHLTMGIYVAVLIKKDEIITYKFYITK